MSSGGDGSAKPTSQPASPKAEAQNQETKTRQMKVRVDEGCIAQTVLSLHAHYA